MKNIDVENSMTNIKKNNKEELISLVPKNKFDDGNLDRIMALSDSEMQTIIPNLLEWTKDINWPIAMPIINILVRRERIIVPYLKTVLMSKDWEWEKWILEYLVSNISDDYICQLKPELEVFIDNEIEDDDYIDLKDTVIKLLERINGKKNS